MKMIATTGAEERGVGARGSTGRKERLGFVHSNTPFAEWNVVGDCHWAVARVPGIVFVLLHSWV